MHNELIIHGEECRPIPGYSRYVASSGGRIYRVVPKSKKEWKAREENPDILYFHEVSCKLQKTKRNFPAKRCGVKRDDDKYICPSVPMLVCKAFGTYPKRRSIGYYQVDYKDGNPENCDVDNIKYVQRRPANHILTEKDVKVIRGLINMKLPLRRIGEIYEVSEMQINRIKTGENWNNGKRLIFPPKAPFPIKDGKIRRFIATFEAEKIAQDDVVRHFTIKRDKSDPTNNMIVGIVKGWKLKKRHYNISIARCHIYRLNKYFFNDIVAERQCEKILKHMSHKNRKPIEELAKWRQTAHA